MFTIHQKRFSSLKTNLISFFTNGANRPGVNRPLRKMVLERIVPGGTGFRANRPVTTEINPLIVKCIEHIIETLNVVCIHRKHKIFRVFVYHCVTDCLLQQIYCNLTAWNLFTRFVVLVCFTSAFLVTFFMNALIMLCHIVHHSP